MKIFARILLHKRIRSSPYTRGQWDRNLENIRSYKRKSLKNVIYQNKKRGTCDYCEQIGQRLTREHLLPKCYGGCNIIIRVCRRCNSQRGNSPCFPAFIRFIRRHPALWRKAKATACPIDAKQYGRFLENVKKQIT